MDILLYVLFIYFLVIVKLSKLKWSQIEPYLQHFDPTEKIVCEYHCKFGKSEYFKSKYNYVQLPNNYGIFSDNIDFQNSNTNKMKLSDIKFHESESNPVALGQYEYDISTASIFDNFASKLLLVELIDLQQINFGLTSKKLFNNNVEFININIDLCENPNSQEDQFILLGIKNNNHLLGIIGVTLMCDHIIGEESNIVFVPTHLHASAKSKYNIDLTNVILDYCMNIPCILVNNQKTKYYDKSIVKNGYKKELKHKLICDIFSLWAHLAGDLKNQKEFMQIGGQNSNYFCAKCLVHRNDTKKEPNLENLKQKQRSIEINAKLAFKYNGDSLIECKGVRGMGVLKFLDARFQLSDAPLHLCEGIFAKLFECIDNRIKSISKVSKTIVNNIKNLGIQEIDSETYYHCKNSLLEYYQSKLNNNEEINIDIQRLIETVEQAKKEWNVSQIAYNNAISKLHKDDALTKWYNGLKKESIKRGHWYKNTMQGNDAQKLIYKCDKLYPILKDCDKKSDIAEDYKMACINGKPIFHFLMHKNLRKLTDNEICTFKRCIINFKGILIKMCNLYQNTDGVGNKIHRLDHAYLYTEANRMTAAWQSESPIENAQQKNLKVGSIYNHYTKHDKLLHQGNWLNRSSLINKKSVFLPCLNKKSNSKNTKNISKNKNNKSKNKKNKSKNTKKNQTKSNNNDTMELDNC